MRVSQVEVVRVADLGLDLLGEREQLRRLEHVRVEAHLVGGVGRADVEHAVGPALAQDGDVRGRLEVRLQAHLLGDLDEQVLVAAPAVPAHLLLSHASSVAVWKSASANQSAARMSAEQRRRRVDALDLELAEGAQGAADRRLAVVAPDDQLADQRVVVRRHLAAGSSHASTRTHGPPGQRTPLDRPGAGHEPLGRVLRVQPQLERGAARPARSGALAEGDAQLLRHQVDPGRHLGDRVLDLDAGVHLDEEELAALVVDQELGRAGAAVADRVAQPHGRLAQPSRRLQIPATASPRSSSAAAAAASTRARTGDRAGAVADHLHLDVARGCTKRST